MNDRTTYSTWMLSFLVGGLAGARVALLLAPQSGNKVTPPERRCGARRVKPPTPPVG